MLKRTTYLLPSLILLVYLVSLYFAINQYEFQQLISNIFLCFLLVVMYVVNSNFLNYWYLISLLLVFVGNHLYIQKQVVSCVFINYVVFSIYIKILLDFVGKVNFTRFILPSFSFLVFCLVIFWLIEDNISGFLALELIYATFVSILFVLSFFFLTEKPSISSKLIFIAIFIDLISTSFIALSKDSVVGSFVELFNFVLFIPYLYMFCRAMINKSHVLVPIKRKQVLPALFLLVVLVSLVLISIEHPYAIYAVPVAFFLFLPMYLLSAYQVNYLFVLYLVLVFIAEFSFLIDSNDFNFPTTISIVSQLLLVFLIYKLKHFKFRNVVSYSVVIFAMYMVLYYFVFPMEKQFVFVLFCFVNSLLAALAIDNYISKMYRANYLLWLGVAFYVLNVAIMSFDLSDITFNFYIFLSNIISHFLICYSFMIRKYLFKNSLCVS